MTHTLPSPGGGGEGRRDEILDFSGLFEHTEGAGLSMELLDAQGNRLASGERFRMAARQGEELLLHVFGVEGPGGATAQTPGLRGAGAYTLVIDALPQVVCLDAEALLPGLGGRPGGPTTSLIVTLQGDRLDPATAEDAANYTVTFLGADGRRGTADDQILSVRDVVYNPGANVEVSSGRTYPTAVRQTVTLLFDRPLPAGSYEVELSPRIQTAAFNESGERPAFRSGPFTLEIADVPGHARGGAVLLRADRDTVVPLTEAIRQGERSFVLTMGDPPPPGLSDAARFQLAAQDWPRRNAVAFSERTTSRSWDGRPSCLGLAPRHHRDARLFDAQAA